MVATCQSNFLPVESNNQNKLLGNLVFIVITKILDCDGLQIHNNLKKSIKEQQQVPSQLRISGHRIFLNRGNETCLSI